MKKKKMSNLPRDLEEEVLCRVPMTSLRRVRSTCKKWNSLFKDRSFSKKYLGVQAKEAAKEREFMVVMVMNFRVYLMRVNLHNNNKVESFIKREGKLISLDDDVNVLQVFHYDGLLLCITKDNTRLLVWNPYLGHTRWIKPTPSFHSLDSYLYVLGYDKTNKSHKILKFSYFGQHKFPECKIYDFNSASWRVLNATPDWSVDYYQRGVSLKGNAYFFADGLVDAHDCFLVCFDFTKETFGPRLPIPIELFHESSTLTLSSVREEQLAVLFHRWDILKITIWVTTKIEPNTVWWNSKVFLSVNIPHQCRYDFTNFFINEENEVAVVFNKVNYLQHDTSNRAYIIGVDGSLIEADLGEEDNNVYFSSRLCSYVPSLVQLN